MTKPDKQHTYATQRIIIIFIIKNSLVGKTGISSHCSFDRAFDAVGSVTAL
jgi:hypothetical protein